MVSTSRKTSNTVNTLVSHAQISNVDGGLIKSVDKAYADIGNTLNYTITIKNTGNTTATSVVLTDTIPTGTSFVNNSVFLNGTLVSGGNPQNGINIGSVAPNATANVVFSVVVTSLPATNPIPNDAIINYKYTIDPSVPNGASASNISNQVTTQINHGEISNGTGGLTKIANKAFADVNETITYTVAMTNKGNVPVNNVVFTDTIPNGTTLVPGSVNINGSPTGGSDPQTGVNIGTINSGQTVTVNFDVKVATIPSPNPIPNQGKVAYAYTVNPANPNSASGQGLTNIVTTQVNTAGFDGAVKTASPQYADIGQTVTYTVALKNTGNVVANNVVFTDAIPNGTSFVPNSVKVNNALAPGTNPVTGINVGSIAPGATTTVAFSVIVNSIPNPNPIINQGKVNYTYTVDPANPNKPGSSDTGKSSNEVNSGQLNPANGSIKKSVDKQYASIGDTVTYTLAVNNLGNATINNLVITDTVPSSLTFVNGSLIVNGSPQPGGSINSGVTVGSVPVSGSATVIFKATVNTVPSSGKAINNFIANYTYTVDPSKPNGVSKSTISNDVVTNINDAVIGKGPNSFSKVADKKYADIGSIITYTITLSNTGNVPGNNVVVNDPIPNGTSLVSNSVTLNGNPTSQTPQGGILVGTINPGSQAVISFQVLVTSIPSPNPISNVANVSYTYTKDPSIPNGESVKGTSTPANTQINNGNVPAGGFTKYGDKTVVKRGDVITYTVTIPNTGNVTITNVVFTDPIPTGTSLVPNSVILNGSVQPGANPANGVQVGSIGPSQTANLLFKVVVNTIPASGNITNQGSVKYQYIVDPSLPPVVVDQNSNSTDIPVRDASINNKDGGFTKAVDKAFAELNDTLTYTFALKNTGNVTATNVVFTDTLVNSLTFNYGSVIVNGVSRPNDEPKDGVTIASIAPNEVVNISFTANVTSIPKNNVIQDTAFVTFNYIQDPTKPPVQGGGASNTVTTGISSTDFSGDNFKKTSSPYYVTIGDTVSYNFYINNAGNTTALNTVFTDSLPKGLSYVKDTLFVGGMKLDGVDPTKAVTLGNISQNKPVTITFKAVVTTMPCPNPAPDYGVLNYQNQVAPDAPLASNSDVSNPAFNQVNSPNLSVIKSSSPDTIAVGDTLKYSIVIANNGNVTAQNVVVNDPLAPQISYIPESLTVNGVTIPNQDIVSGVDIGNVGVGARVTVNFSALVITLPKNGKVRNQANTNYEFVVDPNGPLVEGNTQSNIYQVPVFVAELTLKKTADTDKAVLNQEITYTVRITNTGNITATNIIFKDEIPKELEFVPNTFFINDKKINGVDLAKGINIGNLAPGESATVMYKVTLVKVCCDGTATNAAYAIFNYRTSMTSPEKTKIAGPASVKITTASSTFKEFCLDGVLVVPCPKLDIEEVNELTADIQITSYHVIKTVKGVSDENRRLTGYKLIINGILTQTLEYTANDVVQSVHSAYFERKFSTFIILPEDFQIGTNVNIKGDIEDIYYNQLSSREVFSNITILLDAAVLC